MAKFFNKILDYIGLEEEPVGIDGTAAVESAYVEEEPRPAFGSKRESKKMQQEKKVVSIVKKPELDMVIFRPVSCEDASTMIDSLKARKPVIANFETIDHEKAQRILDIISGAQYALNGVVEKVSKNIYVFAPDNVGISAEAKSTASAATGAGYQQRGAGFFHDSSR